MLVQVKLKDGTTLLKKGTLQEVCDAFGVAYTIYYKKAIEDSLKERELSGICSTLTRNQWKVAVSKVSDSKGQKVTIL